jgi:hypothetical protein
VVKCERNRKKNWKDERKMESKKVKYRKAVRKEILAYRGRGENIIIRKNLVFRTD